MESKEILPSKRLVSIFNWNMWQLLQLPCHKFTAATSFFPSLSPSSLSPSLPPSHAPRPTFLFLITYTHNHPSITWVNRCPSWNPHLWSLMALIPIPTHSLPPLFSFSSHTLTITHLTNHIDEQVSKLKPAFVKPHGTHTAGNLLLSPLRLTHPPTHPLTHSIVCIIIITPVIPAVACSPLPHDTHRLYDWHPYSRPLIYTTPVISCSPLPYDTHTAGDWPPPPAPPSSHSLTHSFTHSIVCIIIITHVIPVVVCLLPHDTHRLYDWPPYSNWLNRIYHKYHPCYPCYLLLAPASWHS